MTDGSCLLVCASPENIPWNTVWPCGLASVEQIKSLTHVGLGEQDPLSGGPHARLCVEFVEACIKCIEFDW